MGQCVSPLNGVVNDFRFDILYKVCQKVGQVATTDVNGVRQDLCVLKWRYRCRDPKLMEV